MKIQTTKIYSSPTRKVKHLRTEEDINIMVNKANDYMRAKPYRPRSRVAKYLGISLTTLYEWAEEGRLELPEYNKDGIRFKKITKAKNFIRSLRDQNKLLLK
jgi:excisionase family DNA binding protein